MSPTVEETPPPPEKKAPIVPGARKNRLVAPPPTQYVKNDEDVPPPPPKSAEARGRMLYAYQENGEGELTVADGTDVAILEPDGMSLDVPHVLGAINRFTNTLPQTVPDG